MLLLEFKFKRVIVQFSQVAFGIISLLKLKFRTKVWYTKDKTYNKFKMAKIWRKNFRVEHLSIVEELIISLNLLLRKKKPFGHENFYKSGQI